MMHVYTSGFQLSLYVLLSISLSGCPRRFLENISMARHCAQRMQPQAMGSNTLSGSIICISVRPSSCTRDFCGFCICIHFQFFSTACHGAFIRGENPN